MGSDETSKHLWQEFITLSEFKQSTVILQESDQTTCFTVTKTTTIPWVHVIPS